MISFLQFIAEKLKFGLVRKLIFIAVIATAILVGCFAFIDWHVRLIKIQSHSSTHARESAENLALAIRYPMAEGRLDVIRDIFNAYIVNNNFAGIQLDMLKSKSISLWADYVPHERHMSPPMDYIQNHLLASPAHIVYDPQNPSKIHCKITIYRSKSQEFKILMTQVKQELIKSFIMAICIAIIISLLFSRFLIRPLEALRRLMETSAESIRRGEIEKDYTLPDVKKNILDLPFHFKEIDRMSESFSQLFQAVSDRQGSLVKSQEDLKTVISAIGDGVLVVDLHGVITHVNPAMAQILGMEKEEALGKHFTHIIRIVNRLTGKIVPSTLEEVLRTSQSASHESPVILFAQNGRQFYVDSLSTPLFDTHGNLSGAVMMVHEQTDKLLVESQLKSMQKMEVVGRLAGGVAHDLNNMLCGIAGAIELLRNTQLTEQQEHHVDLIQRSIGGVSGLIRQLLGFSRQDDIERVEVNIHEILSDAVALVQPGANNVCFTLKFIPYDITVLSDPTLLQSVFLNLLINAKDAMPNGGSLTLSTDVIEIKNQRISRSGLPLREGNYAVITIEDTGNGIPDGILDRVFEPFYTTKPKGKGTGLGLATVFSTVKDLEGAIDVRSTEHKGTAFMVYLKLESAHASAETNVVSVIPAIKPNDEEIIQADIIPVESCSGSKIWINDQDNLVSHLTAIILSENGYTIEESAIEETLFAHIKSQGALLLITDLSITENITDDKVAEIRKACGFFPILVCSSIDVDDLRIVKALRHPETYYLRKPFGTQQLLTLVKNIIENNQNQQNPTTPKE